MPKPPDGSAAEDSPEKDSTADDSALDSSAADGEAPDEDSSDDDAPDDAASEPSAAGDSASDAAESDETVLVTPPSDGPAQRAPSSNRRTPRFSQPDDSFPGTIKIDRTIADAPPPGMTGDRRLAAILFADVAGYTALSSHDEDLALGLIKNFQTVSKKVVSEKGGRVVKFLGDGMLAEFSSLDAAVNAAHALQNSFPYIQEVEESHCSLRVGVHLGDIVFTDDGDVYGSGVNVASRIEGHAPLAGVVVSDSAYQQLRHRRRYQFSSIGEKDLPGVPDPMELYVVLLAGQEAPAPAVRVPTKTHVPPRPAKGSTSKRWMALGLVAAMAAVAFGLDLGGVRGRANQVAQDMGFGDALTGGVFAESPGFRSIEGGAVVDGDIMVDFTGLINPATATGTSVQLLGPGGVIVPAEVSASADASAVDITPLSSLEYATRYRVVFTEALRSASGGAIRPPRGEGPVEDLMSFVTQPVPPEPPEPPELASSEPAEGSTGADGDAPVIATFSKPMNPATLDSSTVVLLAASGAQVAAELTWGSDDNSLRVDPVQTMTNGLYTLVLRQGITDADGIPMVPDTFGFRVGVPARRVVPTGPGRLTVQVVPGSVASRTIVVIDGDTLGPAPIQGRQVSPNTAHQVEIFGTSEFSPRTIRIYSGSQTLTPAQNFTLEADVTLFGTISIDSTPGGRVFIDGEELGPTALVTYPVSAGPVHTLEIRPLDADTGTRGTYTTDFTVELLEDKSLGRVELPAR